MATYAAYRHIELDNVGYSKKRVRNPSSEIFNVMCTPPSGKMNGSAHNTPNRRSSHSDSFNRLFGTPDTKKATPRRASLTKQDVKNRNPVTGNGVVSWDAKPASRNSPRIHNERNPVTGEVYTIVSPASTPTKSQSMHNGFAPQQNGGTSTPATVHQNGGGRHNNNNNNGDAVVLNGNGHHHQAVAAFATTTTNGHAY